MAHRNIVSDTDLQDTPAVVHAERLGFSLQAGRHPENAKRAGEARSPGSQLAMPRLVRARRSGRATPWGFSLHPAPSACNRVSDRNGHLWTIVAAPWRKERVPAATCAKSLVWIKSFSCLSRARATHYA